MGYNKEERRQKVGERKGIERYAARRKKTGEVGLVGKSTLGSWEGGGRRKKRRRFSSPGGGGELSNRDTREIGRFQNRTPVRETDRRDADRNLPGKRNKRGRRSKKTDGAGLRKN